MVSINISKLQYISDQLHKHVTAFSNAASTLRQQEEMLDGSIQDLINGVSGWQGVSSQDFQTAWQNSSRDIQQNATALDDMASELTTLAQKIDQGVQQAHTAEKAEHDAKIAGTVAGPLARFIGDSIAEKKAKDAVGTIEKADSEAAGELESIRVASSSPNDDSDRKVVIEGVTTTLGALVLLGGLIVYAWRRKTPQPSPAPIPLNPLPNQNPPVTDQPPATRANPPVTDQPPVTGTNPQGASQPPATRANPPVPRRTGPPPPRPGPPPTGPLPPPPVDNGEAGGGGQGGGGSVGGGSGDGNGGIPPGGNGGTPPGGPDPLAEIIDLGFDTEELLNRLRQTEEGRHALDVQRKRSVIVQTALDDITRYKRGKNTVNINLLDPDPDVAFIHEMTHAESAHSDAGLPDPLALNQNDYVRSMLNEEVNALVRQTRYIQQAGESLANARLGVRTIYETAYNQALTGSPGNTQAAEEAGRQALYNALANGTILSNANRVPYPQYYADQWNSARSPH